jgi:ABC-2 type transport system ATP-binding protein
MSSGLAISIAGLSHSYGEPQALDNVSLDLLQGEILGILGPNGGGKTTLFRVLSTLLPVQQGNVGVLGFDLRTAAAAIRLRIGVTFQSPSLDRKLTVRENLKHQGHLYGLCGRVLQNRIDELLARLGLTDRAGDRAESLSGGLQRRVEIAKGLLHDPRILLLDEPSTGLDPGARLDLWQYLHQLQAENGVTVLVTTHLMEEAERCDRLAILDKGQLVAVGSPAALRSEIGGDCVTIHSEQPDELSRQIEGRFGVAPRLLGNVLRVEIPRGQDFLRDVADAFPAQVTSMTLGKPTLEDVFVQRTGHRFWEQGDAGDSPPSRGRTRRSRS